MALSVLAYNLSRVMNIIGIRPLLRRRLGRQLAEITLKPRYSGPLQHPGPLISSRKIENLSQKPEASDRLRKCRFARAVSAQPRPDYPAKKTISDYFLENFFASPTSGNFSTHSLNPRAASNRRRADHVRR
jgi:hypothetical protein